MCKIKHFSGAISFCRRAALNVYDALYQDDFQKSSEPAKNTARLQNIFWGARPRLRKTLQKSAILRAEGAVLNFFFFSLAAFLRRVRAQRSLPY